jgi:hypothetical protein
LDGWYSQAIVETGQSEFHGFVMQGNLDGGCGRMPKGVRERLSTHEKELGQNLWLDGDLSSVAYGPKSLLILGIQLLADPAECDCKL